MRIIDFLFTVAILSIAYLIVSVSITHPLEVVGVVMWIVLCAFVYTLAGSIKEDLND